MINNSKKAFSIIEIMIGIFIFSLGLVAVYGIISSTLRLNEYNKNYIIATGLAREQVELVRNIRDSNYKRLKPYNLLNPNPSSTTSVDYSDSANYFNTGSYYKVYNNDFNGGGFPIVVEKINNFGEGKDELLGKMQDYRLCIDGIKYVYCGTTSLPKTNFYKYLKIEEVVYSDTSGNTVLIPDAFKLNSKVIWYKKGYHEFDVDMIVADWRRL